MVPLTLIQARYTYSSYDFALQISSPSVAIPWPYLFAVLLLNRSYPVLTVFTDDQMVIHAITYLAVAVVISF